ncbi:methyl-CpG-binding domain-containing protein 4-like [Olea europaea var. sylvestris]|uniref:methyl-CpG-binding domain-containing protein 4-like n=1 Tax=Olea europaea var. sylvestris TaxID=158386 RepID=UPI000C1D4504|nr:methyl-CpG-binding domain-containing protein 4-like [Olea europaea var. sylvestris]XP_022869053.1 methyl-CpG-binding domain-containing protein 4-like [Olea europaea var. sylvestris]
MKIKAEKTPMKRSGVPRTAAPRNSINVWSVQCRDCFKWRIIPTQEEYEEIRKKFVEDPFVCTKKINVSCNDPTDMEYDNSRVWVVDKPNLPKTPPGFHRGLVLRKDFSKLDCYYIAPNGRKLRAGTEVASFLKENPEFKDLSTSDFSFSVPKVMMDTVPVDAAKVEVKVESSGGSK